MQLSLALAQRLQLASIRPGISETLEPPRADQVRMQ